MKVWTTCMTAGMAGAALLLSLFAGRPAAAQPTEALKAAKIERIEAAITAAMSQKGIPGLSIAIVMDDQLRWQRGYGTADLENFVPAKASTVYRIASVTKSLTAVAAMQLAEKGALDLRAPVQKYAPSFPAKPFPITTRQLLAHLSGIRNYRREEGERTAHYDSLIDALSIFKDEPLEHEPGTRYTYSVFGYTLLGVVIEGASGMTYPDYMRERIFKPAGMEHTFVDDLYALIPNRARGYHPKVYGKFNGEVRNASLMDSSYKIPAGGFVSTAEDMARFAIAVQNGVLIKPETFAQMTRSGTTRDGQDTGYGYGWYVEHREGRTPDGSVWHGGVQQGFTSDLWILPKKHFALVILTNLEGGGMLGLATLANQVAQIVLE
jgi:serine beta-lactamase-like protein LACTB, mitochondrial